MRERLLGVTGAEMPRVYVCDHGGTVSAVLGASVFHWDDLSAGDVATVELDGGRRAADVCAAVGVPLVDLVRAWQIVTDLGHLLGEPVQVVALSCPSCGGDDIADDGSEDCEPGTVERWHMCHTCDATWTDTYVIGSRTVLTSGGPMVAVDSWPEPGPADHLDMAYEDLNGCGVEL